MSDPIIRLKRSSVSGKIPSPVSVPLGELALNTYDGYLYASKDVGAGVTVIAINPFRVGAGTDTYNIYFTLGNVGIGTDFPSEKLDVNGNVSISDNVSVAGTVGIGTRIDIIPYDSLNEGTLSFEGSAGQLFSITNNLTSGSIFSVNDVSGIPSIDVDADGTIQLAPYGSTEYVGIGTTNPTQKLDINGATRFRGAIYDNNNVVGAANSVLTSTGSGVVWAAPSGGAELTIENNVTSNTFYPIFTTGVGTTAPYITTTSNYFEFTPNTGTLDVNNLVVGSTVTATDFNSTSDILLKTNIALIDSPMDKISQINGVSFTWKETQRSSAGVIAQDVEKVLPQLVNGENTKTVNYNGLIGVLIEAVKEQQEQINTLKKEIDKLKG